MIKLKKQQGFTLIELIIVTVLIGFLGVGAVEMLRIGVESQIKVQNAQSAAWDGQIAITRMTEDLHAIKSAADITTASASALTFKNYDGTTVSYALSGGQLLRNSYALADNVTSLVFTYYNSAGSVTTTLANIRYIGINLSITNNVTYDFTTGAFIWSA